MTGPGREVGAAFARCNLDGSSPPARRRTVCKPSAAPWTRLPRPPHARQGPGREDPSSGRAPATTSFGPSLPGPANRVRYATRAASPGSRCLTAAWRSFRSTETWDALAQLFAAGGDPRWCWCQFWRKPGSNWSNTTADDNRRDLRALVDGDGLAPGLVAIDDDGKAVGLGRARAARGVRAAREVADARPSCPATPCGRSTASSSRRARAGRRRERAARGRGRLRAGSRRRHARGVPGQDGWIADFFGVGLHGHVGDVRASGLRRVRAVDLESRLRDAARGDAPGALTASRRMGAGTYRARQVHRQDQQRPVGREGEGRPVRREARASRATRPHSARSAHDPGPNTLTWPPPQSST